MIQFLGVVFLVIILIGVVAHLSGATVVAAWFFVGLAAIAIVIIASIIRRRW